jgi:hypothetical protein
VRPSQPSIQWAARVFAAGVKPQRCEAELSLPSEVKNSVGIPLPPVGFHGVVLIIKAQGNFYFFLTFTNYPYNNNSVNGAVYTTKVSTE